MKPKLHPVLFCPFFSVMVITIMFVSCNRKFDAPPSYIPPDIAANATIQKIKTAHVSGNVDAIANDVIIGGVVIANDSSGNFYKQIIIQDSTGGIAVNIDDYNLYTSFPVGRKIWVKLKGLYIADNAGLPYIGASPDNGGAVSGIPAKLLDGFVVKGETNLNIAPTVVTINDVKINPDKYVYTLVQFNNVEAKERDTSKTYAYATPTVKASASITVKGCNSTDTLVIRTSGYAYFASAAVPNGNGTLTAIYADYKSPYNNKITPQVILRDTSDVQFRNPRCNSVLQPVTPTLTSIKGIRAMYNGAAVVLGAYQIGGVVISDVASKNISSGGVVLQDGDRGISVYFSTPVYYNIGDSIVVTLTNDTLLNYNGSLEIKVAKNSLLPTPVAVNRTVIPSELTIEQLKNSLRDIEYTLVRIKDAAASGTATYSGNQTLMDNTGSMALYTSPSANFATSFLPTNINDWIGYGSFYNTTAQFQIRNLNDVAIDTTTTPSAASDLLISEYVEGSSNNKYLEVYNAGSAAADLSHYKLKLFKNGTTSPSNTAGLDTLFHGANLPPGGIIVAKYPSANLQLLQGVVAHNSPVCGFNGNDVITLEKDGVVIDLFGMIGVDPGTSWTISNQSKAAVDHTIRRKIFIAAGNTNWALSSANEWMIFDKDDVSNLGVR